MDYDDGEPLSPREQENLEIWAPRIAIALGGASCTGVWYVLPWVRQWILESQSHPALSYLIESENIGVPLVVGGAGGLIFYYAVRMSMHLLDRHHEQNREDN